MPRPLQFLGRQLLDLLLGVLVTVAIFLVVEGALRIAGHGGAEVRAPRHLAAGFDKNARIFEPDTEVEGGWRSRFSHAQSKELAIRPKGDATRVLLFGGSNTAGFPARVLQDELNAKNQGKYEVVNLGRAGYGSTRVAILFREAIEVLEPDLVVLYSGHNEFVEKSFAMDLEAAWDNALVARLAGLLESTVTGRLLTEALREEPDDTGAYSRLDQWEAEYQKFEQVPSEQTAAVWDAYEENLRYMCALAGEHGVPLLLCAPVWNRFSAPRIDTPHEGVDEAAISAGRKLLVRARKKYPAQLKALLPEKDKDRVHIFDFGRKNTTRTDGSREEPLPGLRPSVGWLEAQIPGFERHRHWEPKVRAWYQALAWLHGERSEAEAQALEAAKNLLGQTAKELPTSAIVTYELGLVRYALGERGPDVTQLFWRAAELDRAPRKANPSSNARVLAVAADFDTVTLHDSDARFVEGSADGLVGWEWMVDHCHISSGAGKMLMQDFANVLVTLGRTKH
ncbi:MAG: hypothetical protein O2816_01525 [Planctomycetota bacterium]|nr:hypothetical protein [Planctomycetota bacterium]